MDTYGAVRRLNQLTKLWQEGDFPVDGIFDEDYNLYVSGEGQIITHVHEKTQECVMRGCVIHDPTDHVMRRFPTNWRYDRFMMERICDHGIGHPDPDDISFRVQMMGADEAAEWAVHACDGCCREAKITAIVDNDPGDETGN